MTPSTLVERYGSPLYVYDLDEAERAAADLRTQLPSGATLFHSLKANPHPEVVRALRVAGCRAEISSAGELESALLAGHEPGTCLYTGPGKTDAELAHALERGVTFFSAESVTDLRRIARAARRQAVTARCLLRVNGGAGEGTAGLRMTGTASQFGLDLDAVDEWAPAVAGLVADEQVEPVGLHLFAMTNARDEESLVQELLANIRTAALLRDRHGLPVRVLDLGGGFAHPYAVPGDRPRYPGLRSALEAGLDEHFAGWRDGDVEVAFESGRYLSGSCGRLLTTVTDVKESKGRTFVVLDAGVNALGGLAGLRRLPPVRAQAVPAGSGQPVDGREERRVALVGPLCTPSDTLAHDTALPLPAPDDLLAIPNTGAYGLSAGLIGFLSRPAPGEVALRDGDVVSATRLDLRRGPVAGPRARPVDAAERARAVLPVLAEHARQVDAEARFPTESLAALRDSGLMGLLVPTRYGGLGGGLAELAEVAQILASGCLSSAMIWSMHCQQADAVVRFGTEQLRQELLPRIAAGSVYLGSVTSEKQTGGHLLTSAAPLREDGDGLLLERDAPIVTGGAVADGFLMTMRDAPDAPDRAVTLVYADRDRLEVEVSGDWNPLGMRGTHSVALRLKGTVPAHSVVGERGAFQRVAVGAFIPLGHIGWAACWLGAARQALSELLTVFRSPGRPSSTDLKSDLVTERLARIRIDLETVSAYLRQCVEEVSRHRAGGDELTGTSVQIHLNTLKVLASELTYRAADRCVALAGLGLGYRADSPVPLERHLRDLRSAALNYSNDRLLTATGTLCLADRAVGLIGGAPRPVPAPHS
ncbi:acyl-CoA dehydrogenase family protein [Streptomyces sp. NPDC057236]|uniref:acyl-CoA dehydrogenase family protein n=1 Tax=Streptomyces sp. NPDC057236 TaxID=3346059 RepID=UPI00363CC093